MSACGYQEQGLVQPSPSSACAGQGAPSGRVILQTPPTDVSGPFYFARTDGVCGLLVTLTGAPEGDGPCNVAEYVGRVEAAGGDARLVVDERHTGPSRDGEIACALVGANRSMRIQLESPLAGRRLLDPQGRPMHLVDGAELLAFGPLPAGWTAGVPDPSIGEPVHWAEGLRGPGNAWGALRQGTTAVARPGSGFGYTVLERPRVRGHDAVLAGFSEDAGNHVLSWVEGDRGFALQVLGPGDPHVLVDIANGLRQETS